MAGTLYIVATPIGNLRDITFRAVDILSNVDVILAEDKRVTGKLLKEYDISPDKFISYHHYSKKEKKLEILNMLLKGKVIAYVSDAGTPGVSDPGNELIDFLYQNSTTLKESPLKVVPIPGPSSLTAAISVCGYNMSEFTFIGFMPKKGKENLIKRYKDYGKPLVFYESPHRIIKTLKLIKKVYGKDQKVFVARELTKLHETIYRGTVQEVIDELNSEPSIKGEITVIVDLA